MEKFNNFEVKASQVNKIVNKIKEDSYRVLDRDYDELALKLALEKIAQDNGGNLALLPNLEDSYVDLISKEIKLRAEKELVSDFSDLSSLVRKINKNKILDDKKIGEILDSLKSEIL